MCISAISDSLSLTLPKRTFRVIKGKEKKQIIFLYISVVVFLCLQHYLNVSIATFLLEGD